MLKNENNLIKFDRNKKRKRIILGLGLGLMVIIGSLILYKTFAFYEEKAEFNIIKGRVPNFAKDDLEIAMTLDGVKISSLPNKNDGTNKGYDINLVCDGAVGTFDYEKWGILVTNINKENVKCNISFTTKYKEDLLNGSDPVLKNELIPVKISETGVVTYADTKTEWYNYSKKSWANAVILIDSAKSKYKVGNTIS